MIRLNHICRDCYTTSKNENTDLLLQNVYFTCEVSKTIEPLALLQLIYKGKLTSRTCPYLQFWVQYSTVLTLFCNGIVHYGLSVKETNKEFIRASSFGLIFHITLAIIEHCQIVLFRSIKMKEGIILKRWVT